MTQNNTKSEAPHKQGETDKEENSVALQPGLYIVATPIGNLQDVSLRALEVLKSVDLVAAEDTRVTQKLLTAHGISSKLVSYQKLQTTP